MPNIPAFLRDLSPERSSDMPNTAVFDLDLNPVLEKASNEELGILHDIIMEKWSEELSGHDAYKLHYPEHKHYADLIAKEIRDYGGNSFMNLFRGEGPSYKELVCDVAERLKAPFSKDQEIAQVEGSILATVLAMAWDKMTEEEKRSVLKMVKQSNMSWAGGASALAFQGIFRAGGFASYQLTLIVVNAIVKGLIGRGLSLAANAAMMRGVSVLTGPVGLALTSLWAVVQLAGPSYKVTIPAVVYVAMLRAGQSSVRCSECGAMMADSFNFCSECGASIAEVKEKAQLVCW